jgi:hypothetical protein
MKVLRRARFSEYAYGRMRIPIETTIDSSLQATTDSGNIRAVSAEARWHYLLSIIGL